MDFNIGETNIAEIRFQKNTNWDFRIFIRPKDGQNRRTLSISCKGGLLNIDTLNPDLSHVATSVYDKTGKLISNPTGNIENARSVVDNGLGLLIALQARYLREANLLEIQQ
jgi:hypothetical protein